MLYLLDVYVMRSNLKIDRTFTYYSEIYVRPFCRVALKFNRSSMMGLVYKVNEVQSTVEELEKELGYHLLKIDKIIDERPLIDENIIDLAKWLAKTTVSPFMSCLNIMLPKAFKVTKKETNTKKAFFIKKNHFNAKLTQRQSEVYDLLSDGMRYKEARSISEGVLKKLIELGAVSKYEKEDTAISSEEVKKIAFKKLTKDQETVYQQIINSDHLINLLYGVTGSGKTEVYLHLARHYLSLEKQVLILVPEIALTPQMIERVKERFGDVAIYHSYLSDNERYNEYKRIQKREVNVVVGTRSAIFLPFKDLGVIIIDEEHDHSYKQDNTPCYNAKQVAFKRANDFKAKVLLASATPSLETYSRALKGDYGFFKLDKRINESMPEIKIVDLKEEIKNGGSYIITGELKEELSAVLASRKQAIILLNRRGYAPIIRCADCNSILMCEDCETALTYHNDTDELKCNMCGRVYKMVDHCPNCGKDHLISYGLGTKKVVETLEKMFPDAKVGRMDADNTHVKNGHAKILEAFGKKEYDILVGTQMIAKGLDYPDVVLVGILNADSGLLRTSFNSPETTFDLLMQASGRSGRAKDEGKVIIQTFNTDHYVIKAVQKQDYNYFYNIEMNYRRKADYPPYTHFINIIMTDDDHKRIERSSVLLDELLKNISDKHYRPYKLNKVMKKERYRFTFISRNLYESINELTRIIDQYVTNTNVSSIKVDIDPLYME